MFNIVLSVLSNEVTPQPAYNLGQLASEAPFEWRFPDGPIAAHFYMFTWKHYISKRETFR